MGQRLPSLRQLQGFGQAFGKLLIVRCRFERVLDETNRDYFFADQFDLDVPDRFNYVRAGIELQFSDPEVVRLFLFNDFESRLNLLQRHS